MTQTTYYTVIIGKRSCLVTYATSPAYETKLFSGAFPDPGEASQQFKKTMQGELEYVSQGVFNRKVSDLAYRYKSDLIKLAAWNQSNATSLKGRKPSMPLTNEEYINNLPVSALEQTEEYLQQDLARLTENDLPVNDTVASLLAIHARLEEQDTQDATSSDV